MTHPMDSARPRVGAASVLLAAVLALALSALLLAPVHASPGRGPNAPDRQVRIVDYNIRAARGLDTSVGGDIDAIAAAIRAADPDIVTLQEVDRHFGERSGFIDQAAHLGDALDMHVAYGPNLEWAPLGPGAPVRQYGTAILTAYPILEYENVALPVHGSPRPAPEDPPVDGEVSEPRGALTALINVRGVPLTVITTHLQSDSTSPSPESGRQQRTEQVARIVELAAAARGPAVVTGDFNALPEDPELAHIRDVMTDAWMVAGDGSEGHTAYLPALDRRIDYVFTSQDIAVDDVEIRQAYESDHLPIAVDLSLPGSAVGIGRR